MTGDWKPVGYSGNIKVGDVVEFDVLRKDRFVRWRGKVLGVRNLGIGREEYIIKRDELSVDGFESESLKHELIRVNDHPNHRQGTFTRGKICYKVNSYEVELI